MRRSLACGLVAPALSLATDVLACARWKQYRPMEQSISELSAVGAPTRRLAVGLGLTRDALLVAFARGVRQSRPRDRTTGITGALVLVNAAADALAITLLPRDYVQPTWSRRNTANTLVMATGVFCSIGAMGMGALAIPGWFRLISAGVPLAYAGLTVLSLVAPPRGVRPGVTTGAQERTMAYSYLLWVAVLADTLLRLEARMDRRGA